MSNQNYTTTFLVDQTPEEAFAAINNVRGWWSGEIEGSTDKLGDEFTYRYKDVHYSKQKLVELVPSRKVVWLILDAWLSFTEDKASGTAQRSSSKCRRMAIRSKSGSLTTAWFPNMSASISARTRGASISTAVCGV